MKADVAITYTRHTGKFSRTERTEQASFDSDRSSFVEEAATLIEVLREYVENVRARRRLINCLEVQISP
jgi:hypothetical protein